MSRGEWVDTDYWDVMEAEGFSIDATNIFLWSFTNRRCNYAGLYAVSERQIYNGRLSVKRTMNAVRELQEGGKLYYDKPLLWVKARAKRVPAHGNFLKSIAKDVAKIQPDNWMRVAFLEIYAPMAKFKGELNDLALESGIAQGLPTPSKNGVGSVSVTDAVTDTDAVASIGGSSG